MHVLRRYPSCIPGVSWVAHHATFTVDVGMVEIPQLDKSLQAFDLDLFPHLLLIFFFKLDCNLEAMC